VQTTASQTVFWIQNDLYSIPDLDLKHCCPTNHQ
jgi:hypothetical protein